MSAAAMSANESQGNVGYIIAGVVAAAAIVTAGWPSLVEYGTAAIEWISSTLHDLPENEVRVCKLHVDCVAALRSHTLDIKSIWGYSREATTAGNCKRIHGFAHVSNYSQHVSLSLRVLHRQSR